MTHETFLLTPRFLEALQLAYELHGQDSRKSSTVPVFAHLLSVCALVLYDGGTEDEAIAALLHDALEDKPGQITREGIRSKFGGHVTAIVELSTDTPADYTGGPKPPWRQRKEAYLEQVRRADPGSLQVTIADKVDNARAMLADYRQVGGRLWNRFNASHEEVIWYYRECVRAYEQVGVNSPLLEELRPLVVQLGELPIHPSLPITDFMAVDKTFRFAIPKQPDLKPISAEEAERLMLQQLEKSRNEFQQALWDLAYLYSRTGQQQVAQGYIDRYLANADDPEKQAGAYLALGQLMEQMNDYEAAISFYRHAFSLEPENTPAWYFINNNLGYCLNQLDRFSEAEMFCRGAIKIDPQRHNAYKNLGVSLTGQGKCADAARNFVQALRANAADPRALKLLEQLFDDHPEITGEIPDIEAEIRACQEAVKAVEEVRRKMNGAGEDTP
jgi:tetratricopeptide (TPR) repeat protein